MFLIETKQSIKRGQNLDLQKRFAEFKLYKLNK